MPMADVYPRSFLESLDLRRCRTSRATGRAAAPRRVRRPRGKAPAAGAGPARVQPQHLRDRAPRTRTRTEARRSAARSGGRRSRWPSASTTAWPTWTPCRSARFFDESLREPASALGPPRGPRTPEDAVLSPAPAPAPRNPLPSGRGVSPPGASAHPFFRSRSCKHASACLRTPGTASATPSGLPTTTGSPSSTRAPALHRPAGAAARRAAGDHRLRHRAPTCRSSPRASRCWRPI